MKQILTKEEAWDLLQSLYRIERLLPRDEFERRYAAIMRASGNNETEAPKPEPIRRLLRINVTKPIRSHPIVRRTWQTKDMYCCLCHQKIEIGQLYHTANKRQAHVKCPRRQQDGGRTPTL